jgi:acetyl/propionyl-CoA carboxylase alpha subunit
MGDKINSKKLAAEAGVRTISGASEISLSMTLCRSAASPDTKER